MYLELRDTVHKQTEKVPREDSKYYELERRSTTKEKEVRNCTIAVNRTHANECRRKPQTINNEIRLAMPWAPGKLKTILDVL